jgi:hypothetical protein
MKEGEYVDSLVNEYAVLLAGRLSDDPQSREVDGVAIEELLTSADWTMSGARELMNLVNEYGAFILRNALAIAVALGKEDGTRGL